MADRIIDRRLLADAMSTLSDPHRQTMFHLLYLGRTTKQTATAMGVPIGTAKSRAHYAGRALQQALIGGGVRAA
jgi:RNA polymerase sigma-70 factor (ECF subfamily)